MATNRRILNLPLILSGKVTNSIVLPLDDPSDNLTKKINLGQIKDFVLSGVSLSGNYLSLSGGTVTGSTSFTNGLTANTISATTLSGGTLYGDGSNLTGISTQDTFVTGGTYSNGTATFTNNTGGTFNVTGLTTPFTGGTVTGSTSFTNGLTANTLTVNGINITGDTYVSGGTYNTGGTLTLSYNIGGGFQITGLTEDLNNEISTLAEADEQTITLNLITNKIELKESVASPSGGTRTFQGNIIVNSGLTANSFIINNSYTPTSSGDTFGSIGQLTWDDDYLYVKTNNGWGRTILDYIF